MSEPRTRKPCSTTLQSTGDSWTLAHLIGGVHSIGRRSAVDHLAQRPRRRTTSSSRPTRQRRQSPAVHDRRTSRASTASQTNRLVFSMGCHAGLSVADSIVTSGASTLDWPQAFAQKGARRLPRQHRLRLRRQPRRRVLGGAEPAASRSASPRAPRSAPRSAAAKQAYYGRARRLRRLRREGDGGVHPLRPADVDESRDRERRFPPRSAQLAPRARAEPPVAKNTAVAPAAARGDPRSDDRARRRDFQRRPDRTRSTRSRRLRSTGRARTACRSRSLRPIQPKQYRPADRARRRTARCITELTSNDTNCIDPVYARPVVDLTANEPELAFADVAFPSKLQTVRTFETPTGTGPAARARDGPVLHPAVRHEPGPAGRRAAAVQSRRPVTSSARRARTTSRRRSTSSARRPSASNAAFSIDVDDLTPTGPGVVKQVLVGVRSGGSSTWTFANLAQSAGNPLRWTGGVPIVGSSFEYFVQAVDAAGNVAVSTNKGFYFVGAPAPPPPTGGIEATLIGPHPTGWFTSGAGLVIDAPPGVTVEASVDGGLFGPPPATITGDGLHIIELRASNGGTATLFAPIDTTPPEIVLSTPANGGVYTLNSDVKADYFVPRLRLRRRHAVHWHGPGRHEHRHEHYRHQVVHRQRDHRRGRPQHRTEDRQLHGRLPPDSLLEHAHGRRRHLLGEFQRHKPHATDVDVRARRAGLMVT